MAGTIVRAAIHPAIGIARLGSSRRGYLLAPQVPDPLPRPVNSSHDAEGELKREVVEFRIYGYDGDGKVVAELTADNAEIDWRVHVANTKAAWYKFRHAMDIPSLSDTVVERRNPGIVGPVERSALSIDPGPRSIRGRNQDGLAQHRFDTGTFKGLPVYLGELRTDGLGRLMFFGSRGVSRSPGGAPPYVSSDSDAFGNAADWHDDICDGPVDAVVRVDGVEIPTEGAWVVTAPPNYAPDLKSWRTLYDALVDVYVEAGWMARKSQVSFTEDIYPILARLSGLQWVNKSHAAVFGAKAPFDFTDPGLILRISQVHGGRAVDTFKPLRTAIFKIFREQAKHASDPAAWPWLYGDSYGTADAADPHGNLAVTGERLRYLEAWRDGNFVRRLGQASATIRHDRRGRAFRAAGDARPCRAGLLRRRRLPSGDRADVADASHLALHGAVPHQAGNGAGARLRAASRCSDCALGRGAAAWSAPWVAVALDAAALADRHRRLPRRI